MSAPILDTPDAQRALATLVGRNMATFNRQLSEAAQVFYTDLGLMDLYGGSLYGDLDGFGWPGSIAGAVPVAPYQRSQKRGELIPVYQNEDQLFRIRDRNRRLAVENEFAINCIENRVNYTVGEGLTYRAVPRGNDPAKATDKNFQEKYLKPVQEVIDLFAESNRLNELEADCMMRYDRDGEFFLREFRQSTGLILLRVVEPEHVRSPVGDGYGARHSFGVETLPKDVESVVGYWIIENPLEDPEPRFVEADNVLHVKANCPRNSKRGVPTFYPVELNLRRAEDLLGSMTSLAKTRAKIGLIRKFKGVAKTAATDLVNNLIDATATDAATGISRNLERLGFGTILNASDTIDYEMPGADVDASSFVAILECELRAIAARLVMPSWMLLTSATDANYATALVAEAPSVKMFKRLQGLFTSRFGRYRIPGPHLSLVWRQIRHAIRVGLLPKEVLTEVEIKAEAPSLVVRDQQAEAATNKIYNEMGVKPIPMIRAELGIDNDQADADFAKYPAQQPMMPGMHPDSPIHMKLGKDGEPLPPDEQEQQDADGEPFEPDAEDDSTANDPFGEPDAGERRPRGVREGLGLVTGDEQDEDAEDEPRDQSARAAALADLLLSVYGDRALELFDRGDFLRGVAEVREAWNPSAHPRDPKTGRFIARNSAEAVSTAKSAIKDALAKPHSPHGMSELLNHLNLLTTRQINALKKDYGVKATGRNREELVAKIADRLSRGRRAEAEKPKEQPKPEQKPTQAQADRQAAMLERAKRQYATAKEELDRAFPHGRPANYAKGYDDRKRQVDEIAANIAVLEKPPEAKEKPTPTSPMTGHSLAGKSEAEMRQEVARLTEFGKAKDNDPYKIDTGKLPSRPDAEQIAHDITTDAAARISKNAYASPNFKELYDAARAKHPDLTIREFHQTIAKLSRDGTLSLSAYTQAPAHMPSPEMIAPIGREAKFYVKSAKPAAPQPEQPQAAEKNGAGAFSVNWKDTLTGIDRGEVTSQNHAGKAAELLKEVPTNQLKAALDSVGIAERPTSRKHAERLLGQVLAQQVEAKQRSESVTK